MYQITILYRIKRHQIEFLICEEHFIFMNIISLSIFIRSHNGEYIRKQWQKECMKEYPYIILLLKLVKIEILKGRKICISEWMKYSMSLVREKQHKNATTNAFWKLRVGERIFVGMIWKVFLEEVVAKMSFDKLGFDSLCLSIIVAYR